MPRNDWVETLVILVFICLLGISLADDSVTRIIWVFIWAIVFSIWLYKVSTNQKEELLRENEV